MAELLIFAIDTTPHPDPRIAAKRFLKGMVITIQPDGVAWGRLDIGPHSHLVKLPGVPVDAVLHLMGPMYEQGPVLGAAPTVALLRMQCARRLPLTPFAPGDDLQRWLADNFETLTPMPLDDPRVIG